MLPRHLSERCIGVIITVRHGPDPTHDESVAIAGEGGLPLRIDDRLVPDLLLVGRNADRLKAVAAAHRNQRWTTSPHEVFVGGPDTISMDCAATVGRRARVHRRSLRASTSTSKNRPPTVEEAMAILAGGALCDEACSQPRR